MRGVAIGVWIVLMVFTLGFAPEVRPDAMAWVQSLMSFHWEFQEPLVVALFFSMGLWPVVIAGQLWGALAQRPVPLWPFVVGSSFLGCFVLAPGVAALPPAKGAPWRPQGRLGRYLGTLVFSLVLGAFIGLWVWAYRRGNPAQAWALMKVEGFLAIMTVDFLAFYALSLALAFGRRLPLAPLSALPLVGAALALQLSWPAQVVEASSES